MHNRELVIPSHPLSWRSWRFRLVMGMLALVLIVRLVWGWQTGRALAALMDFNRERREPVTLGDLNPKTLADADNAWLVQMRAASSIVAGVDSPRASNDTYRDYPPYPAKWMARSQVISMRKPRWTSQSMTCSAGSSAFRCPLSWEAR